MPLTRHPLHRSGRADRGKTRSASDDDPGVWDWPAHTPAHQRHASQKAIRSRISLLCQTTTCDPHSLREWPFCGHVAGPMGILWARLGPIPGRRAVIQRADFGLTYCEIGG